LAAQAAAAAAAAVALGESAATVTTSGIIGEINGDKPATADFQGRQECVLVQQFDGDIRKSLHT